MSDFLGKGPRFPLAPFRSEDRPGKDQFFGLSEGEDKIEQSIRLILGTAPGERVMRPDFGCGVHELLFEPLTPALIALTADRVTTSLRRWEPRIDVLAVDVQTPESLPNGMEVRVTYRVRANNAVHNMVYPFFLHEGAA